MSPRAACRLEQLGFTEVYDYVPGKSDWTAAGLPREGESADSAQAGDVVDTQVPTCGFRNSLEAARERARGEGRGVCVAVTADNVVMGILQEGGSPPDGATVEDAMRTGPTTVRANEPLGPLVERMTQARVDAILVTDPEGRLLGLLDRQHASHVLQGAAAAG